MDLPEITEVQRLQIRSGDRIIVYVDRDLSMAQVREVANEVQQTLLVHVPVLVLPREFRLEVIGPDEEEGFAGWPGP